MYATVNAITQSWSLLFSSTLSKTKQSVVVAGIFGIFLSTAEISKFKIEILGGSMIN